MSEAYGINSLHFARTEIEQRDKTGNWRPLEKAMHIINLQMQIQASFTPVNTTVNLEN